MGISDEAEEMAHDSAGVSIVGVLAVGERRDPRSRFAAPADRRR